MQLPVAGSVSPGLPRNQGPYAYPWAPRPTHISLLNPSALSLPTSRPVQHGCSVIARYHYVGRRMERAI